MPLSFLTSRTRSARGQTLAEFALVAPLFFLLIFGVIDYAWLMFAQSNIQQAIDDGGRYASTGQESGGSGTRISSIVAKVQSEINVPGVSASNMTICSVPPGGGTSSCWNSGLNNGNTGAAGGPEYTETLTLTTTLPLMTPLIGRFFPAAGYTFTSSTTFMNEPFDPSTTK